MIFWYGQSVLCQYIFIMALLIIYKFLLRMVSYQREEKIHYIFCLNTAQDYGTKLKQEYISVGETPTNREIINTKIK